jgi:predicted kinase
MIPKLVVLVGNIACGKSYVAELLHKEYDFYCISLDGMRRMFGAGQYVFDTKLEGIIIPTELHMLKRCLQKKLDIVIDDARHVNVEFRRQTLELAKEYGYTTVIIELPKLSMKQCVQRRLQNNFNMKFDKALWESVYKKFHNMYNEVIEGEADLYSQLKESDNFELCIEKLLNKILIEE